MGEYKYYYIAKIWLKKLCIFLFLGLAIILSINKKVKCLAAEQINIQNTNQQVGTLYAQSAVLMDGSSGRILYEKNGEEFLANASTTKILTCILALENAELSEIVTV